MIHLKHSIISLSFLFSLSFINNVTASAECFTEKPEGKDVISCSCWNCPDGSSCTITLYTHLAGVTPNVACNMCASGEYQGYECQYADSAHRRKKR